MEIKDFNTKFTEIVNNIENTNYGSIIAQLKLVLLIQEFYLTNNFSKNEIIKLFENGEYQDLNTEAQDEVLGEIATNLNDFHICKSILDDLGECYLKYLFSILNNKHALNVLFKECNS